MALTSHPCAHCSISFILCCSPLLLLLLLFLPTWLFLSVFVPPPILQYRTLTLSVTETVVWLEMTRETARFFFGKETNDQGAKETVKRLFLYLEQAISCSLARIQFKDCTVTVCRTGSSQGYRKNCSMKTETTKDCYVWSHYESKRSANTQFQRRNKN